LKPPSPVELKLLCLVATHEYSGGQLFALYEKLTGTSIPHGTLYTTYHRLKKKGWVTIKSYKDSDGRIRIFKITNTGIKALAEGRKHHTQLAEFGHT